MVAFRRALKNVQFFCHEVYVCLAHIKFVAIPATSFVDDFRHLRAVEAILVRKVGFDAAFVLKYNLKVDKSRICIHRISNV